MTMRTACGAARSTTLFLACFVAVHCGKEPVPPPTAPTAPIAPTAPTAPPGLAPSSSSASAAAATEPGPLAKAAAASPRLLCPNEQGLETPLSEAQVVAAQVLSPRSLSLRLRLEGGAKAVWKPVLTGSRRSLNEVASYRLARRLGVCEVPVSLVRKLPLPRLVALLGPGEAATALERQALVGEDGLVSGAMIAWVEDIDDSALSAHGGRAWLDRLLADAASGPNPSASKLARQYSRMLVFDHVTGNWDRFSGGNLFLSGDSARLVLIDHNNSLAPWSDRQAARMRSQLLALPRFDQPQIDALRSLRAQEVRTILADLHLLDDRGIDLLLARANEVLARVSEVKGSGEVPYLP